MTDLEKLETEVKFLRLQNSVMRTALAQISDSPCDDKEFINNDGEFDHMYLSHVEVGEYLTRAIEAATTSLRACQRIQYGAPRIVKFTTAA